MTALQRALDAMPVARSHADRISREQLLDWLSGSSFCKPINRAARWCIAEPLNPEASMWLLKMLMQQIRRRFRGETRYLGHADLHEQRGCFRAVARTYLKQRASVNAQKSMNGFLNSLTGAAE